MLKGLKAFPLLYGQTTRMQFILDELSPQTLFQNLLSPFSRFSVGEMLLGSFV
ncbi:hypothetical protein [Nostoc sp. MG11]|uniref:hypothetical protein n=1 Tax=Nostoc sp. MG11 TaxID=2721166 RepID=UPI001867A388|nr:hypothetical protein [Nostoc sp. MG11]